MLISINAIHPVILSPKKNPFFYKKNWGDLNGSKATLMI